MTYITKVCPKCGYRHRAAIYGYLDDPIGIRVARCPACNCLIKEGKAKEWVQMTPFQKYRAIHPRLVYRVGFFALFVGAFITVSLEKIIPIIQTENGGVNLFAFLFGYALAFAGMHQLFTSLELTGKVFEQRYCKSILRSRNKSYMELLKEEGPIYDESLPSWVLCSKSTRQKFEDYLRENADYTNTFKIPTFVDTIDNDI